MSSKYSKKLVDSAKNSATDAIKTTSKRAIQKKAEATGCLIGNEILQKNPQKSCTQENCHQIKLIMKYQKKDIFLQNKDNKLLMN